MRVARHFFPILIAASMSLGGCANDKESRDNLTAGYASLASSQDDGMADAISRSDAQLAKDPRGPGSAEALYLRGRALEQRTKKSPEEARNDLAAARQAYVQALAQNPPPSLLPSIQTSLGNVCYWQDDFASAIQEWSAAYGKTNDAGIDAFILYRIGLSQQRAGRFGEADETFGKVQQRYPSTEAADRAKAHVGVRSFAVQLATFATGGAADAAVRQIAHDAVNPRQTVDPRGRHIVMIGPCSNYLQAEQLKNRYARQFPDAVIVP